MAHPAAASSLAELPDVARLMSHNAWDTLAEHAPELAPLDDDAFRARLVLADATTARPSLVCDLVEELRAPAVDALVLAAINRRAIRIEDFEDIGPDEPVVLKRETVRWFITLFERHLERGAHYEPLGKRLSWRDIAERQARRYARFVLDDAPEYETLTTR